MLRGTHGEFINVQFPILIGIGCELNIDQNLVTCAERKASPRVRLP